MPLSQALHLNGRATPLMPHLSSHLPPLPPAVSPGPPQYPPDRKFEVAKQYANAVVKAGQETNVPVLNVFEQFQVGSCS